MNGHLHKAPSLCPLCQAVRTTRIGGNPDGSNSEGWDYSCGSFWLRGVEEMFHPPECKLAAAKQRAVSLTPALPLPSSIA